MADKTRRRTGKCGSDESKFSKSSGPSLKSCQTQREFNSAMAIVLGVGFREELLQHWIVSENTSIKDGKEIRELQLLRLRGSRTKNDLNSRS